VGFVLGEKATRLDPDKVPVHDAPDIAIEVISPTERPPRATLAWTEALRIWNDECEQN